MKEKNIWLLPTKNPSRLWINNITDKIELSDYSDVLGALNIYITSSEKPKEGEYGLGFAEGTQSSFVFKHEGFNIDKLNTLCENTQKIIITSDEKLIANGVQRIEEKFLHWFVQNSSCDYVEVKKVEHLTNMPYRTILPQEETKQDLEKEMFELEQELDIPSYLKFHNSKKEPNFYEKLKEYFENTPREKVLEDWKKSANLDNVGPIVDEFLKNSDEERLKDAAENYFKEKELLGYTYEVRDGFIDGVKSDIARDYWYEKFKNEQEKKMYTNEEILTLLIKRDNFNHDYHLEGNIDWQRPKDWIETI
jgi:hypothetical protein